MYIETAYRFNFQLLNKYCYRYYNSYPVTDEFRKKLFCELQCANIATDTSMVIAFLLSINFLKICEIQYVNIGIDPPIESSVFLTNIIINFRVVIDISYNVSVIEKFHKTIL